MLCMAHFSLQITAKIECNIPQNQSVKCHKNTGCLAELIKEFLFLHVYGKYYTE